MPETRIFDVTKPPSGREVWEAAVVALKDSGVLSIVILEQDNADAVPQSVDLRVTTVSNPLDGTRNFRAHNERYDVTGRIGHFEEWRAVLSAIVLRPDESAEELLGHTSQDATATEL